jgi:hypothetical protein
MADDGHTPLQVLSQSCTQGPGTQPHSCWCAPNPQVVAVVASMEQAALEVLPS